MPTERARSELALRQLVKDRDLQVGAAVAVDPLRADDRYAEVLAREFNMVTPENALKFEPVHPAPDRYTFEPGDAIVAFAAEHEMRVRGHTLVWHNQLPVWLTEGSWTRDELIQVLQEHITTVVGRYKGRIVAWDVVNEAVADNGTLRETIWLDGIGPDYIALAFQWAHAADPDALLFYNDYGGEGLGVKSDAIYALVGELLQQGVPLHGVGLQMHHSLEWSPDPHDVAANMARLSHLGLRVHITEMDIRVRSPVATDDLAQQARIYGDIMRACLSATNCEAFVLWGFTDRYSWIPQFFPGYEAALIFDESYRPKPAYDALWEALQPVIASEAKQSPSQHWP